MEDDQEVVKPKRSAKILRFFIFFILIVCLLYVGGAYFFSSHYTYGTVIAGKDCSFKSKEEVYNSFNGYEPKRVIIISGRDNREWSVYTDEFETRTDYDLSGLDRNHNDLTDGFGWIKMCIDGRDIAVIADVVFDEESFENALNNSVLCSATGRKEPQNAFLAGYNDQTGVFDIKEGAQGNVLDNKKVDKYLEQALTGILAQNMEIHVNLTEGDCYKKSNMSVENAKLVGEKSKADKMLGSKISYDWNGVRVIVDHTIIKDWLDIYDNTVTLNKNKVHAFLLQTAEYNDTYNKPMFFRTTGGHNISIDRGDYGWATDVEKETELLIDDILNGRDISREPEYIHTAYVKGQNDVGPSYVEIDLSNQHLYLYINNKLDFETDVVTGNVSAGHKTPEGIYGVTYKARNAILRGPGYESFVYYWMPYNGGVGMHDATWRGRFGGEIYKYSGSHGCINMPLSSAKYIFEKVEQGFPVVSYW